jgi:hypothetical protein
VSDPTASAGGTAGIAPGWYADPSDPSQLRWWSGEGWTEHVSPIAQPAEAAVSAQAESVPAESVPAESVPAESEPAGAESDAPEPVPAELTFLEPALAEPSPEAPGPEGVGSEAVAPEAGPPEPAAAAPEAAAPAAAAPEASPFEIPASENPVPETFAAPVVTASSDPAPLPSRRALRASGGTVPQASAPTPAPAAQTDSGNAAPETMFGLPVAQIPGPQVGTPFGTETPSDHSLAASETPATPAPASSAPASSAPASSTPAFETPAPALEPAAQDPATQEPESLAPPAADTPVVPDAAAHVAEPPVESLPVPVAAQSFGVPPTFAPPPTFVPAAASTAPQDFGAALQGPGGADGQPGEASAQWGLEPRGGRPDSAVDTETRSTPWVWLVAITPIIAGLTIGYALSQNSKFEAGNVLLIVAIIAPYLLGLLFAAGDFSRLRTSGHDAPAHWGWAALTAPVYLIMRAGAVRRETGNGGPALIVWFIAVILAVLGIVGYGFITGTPLVPGLPG